LKVLDAFRSLDSTFDFFLVCAQISQEWKALYLNGVTFIPGVNTKYHTMTGVKEDLKSDADPPSLEIVLRAGTAFGNSGELYLWMSEHRLQTSHRLSRDLEKGIAAFLRILYGKVWLRQMVH
jgi:hypothetical protein